MGIWSLQWSHVSVGNMSLGDIVSHHVHKGHYILSNYDKNSKVHLSYFNTYGFVLLTTW